MTPRRTHLYNILVAVSLVVVLAGLALESTPQTVRARPLQQNAQITADSLSKTIAPGQTVSFTLTIANNLGATQTFTPTITNQPANFPATFTFNPTPLTIQNGQTTNTTLQIAVPANQAEGSYQFNVSVPYPGATSPPNTQLQVVVQNPTATFTPSSTATTGVAQGQVNLTPPIQSKTGDAGQLVTYDLQLTNATTDNRNFTISTSNLPTGVSAVVLPSASLGVNSNQTVSFQVVLTIASNATPGTTGAITVQAQDQSNSNVRGSALLQITVTVNGQTPTQSPTSSQTSTSTPTTGPSLTATPPICQDAYEPDNDKGSAKPIEINLPQPSTAVTPNVPTHTICPVGDEDWLFFGGLSGKVYTIDITEMAPGIDLSLALYDDQGRLLAFNDDYYNRPAPTPDARNNPQGNDTTNIRPRIQSWTAKDNGRYYIQVRDAAGRGRERAAYSIVVSSESYGPTPTQIAELCQDLFEPDGLPEEARLITSNEVQLAHTLCPTGDADWNYFFGKAGKTYFLFTDTRPYTSNNPRNNAPINKDTEAGADTIIFLTDRDGVSLLDFNDDIPGGSTLDSQIEFTPSADGFYFIQIKNVGDIGNQFIRYDFTLQLCLPGQTDCGRPRTLPATPTLPPTSGGAASSTPAEFDANATLTPTQTATSTTQAVRSNSPAASLLTPAEFIYRPLLGLWREREQLVAQGP